MRALATVAAVVLAGCGSTARPIANAGAAQRTAMAGVALTFDGSASTGTISSYVWDFGDGTDAVTAEMVSHAFAMNGDYTVTLTARGPGGASSATVLVSVGASCSATAVIVVGTTSPMPGSPVLFQSTGSSGCMGAMLTEYDWDFGDSSNVDGGPEKQTVSHTYATMGTYDVKLRVVDAQMNAGAAERSLGVGVVSAGVPSVTCPPTAGGRTNNPVQLTANGSDPGGMSLTFTWTFSEGGTAMGSNVMHTYAAAGSYSASVVATTSDSRASTPCVTSVTVTDPVSYTGDWLVSPTGSNFQGTCPFSVNFPTASLSIFNTDNPDGGGSLLVVTPNGGTYPAGYEMSGTEDTQTPGSFVVSRATPNENECGSSQSTKHTLHLLFTSPTLVSGNWTKQYNGCIDTSCIDCNCVAGGPTNGVFSGVKH